MDSETVKSALDIATSVVGIASIIAAFTPTPVDDGVLGAAKKVLNILAFNVRHARNQEDKNTRVDRRHGK